MTVREKIADWITGGLLTNEREAASRWRREYLQAKADYVSSCSQSDKGWHVAHKAFETLRQIAAQETPGANATVKRMARMAREGYGG